MTEPFSYDARWTLFHQSLETHNCIVVLAQNLWVKTENLNLTLRSKTVANKCLDLVAILSTSALPPKPRGPKEKQFQLRVKPHMAAIWRTISVLRTANGKITIASKINPNQISQAERSACHRGWDCCSGLSIGDLIDVSALYLHHKFETRLTAYI